MRLRRYTELQSFGLFCKSKRFNTLDAFSSEKLLYMSNSPMINKRVTRKCIDAARQNAILESRKRVGTKEMVFDSDAQGVYIGGDGVCMNKPVLVFLFPNFESFQHRCLFQIFA